MKPHQRYFTTITLIFLTVVFYALSFASLFIPGEKAEQMLPVFFAVMCVTIALIPFTYWAEKSAQYYD